MKRIMKNLTLKMKAVLLFALAAIVLAATGFALLFGRSGEKLSLTAEAEEIQLDEYVDTEITHYNNWVSIGFDETYGYGSDPLSPDPDYARRVYQSTTLWDIKTRLKVVANVTLSSGSGGSSYVLKPNEFNLTVDFGDGKTVFNDRENGVDSKPFENVESLSWGTTHAVKVTVFPLAEIEAEPELTLPQNEEQHSIHVIYQNKAPVFEENTLQALFTEGKFVYPNTEMRSYNIYSFDYRASIKARYKGSETAYEVPREFVTCTISSGNSFSVGSGNSVSIQLLNGEGSNLNSNILNIPATSTTPKALRIAVNTNPENIYDKYYSAEEATDGRIASTIYSAKIDGNGRYYYYRKIGAKIPYKEEDGYGASNKYLESSIEHKYSAFTIGTEDYLILFALRAHIYDNNGGMREVLASDQTYGEFSLSSGTSNNNPNIVSKIILDFKPADTLGGGATITSNTLELWFVNHNLSYIDAHYYQWEDADHEKRVEAVTHTARENSHFLDADGNPSIEYIYKRTMGKLDESSDIYFSDLLDVNLLNEAILAHGDLEAQGVYNSGLVLPCDLPTVNNTNIASPMTWKIEGGRDSSLTSTVPFIYDDDDFDDRGELLVRAEDKNGEQSALHYGDGEWQDYKDGYYIRWFSFSDSAVGGTGYFPAKIKYEEIKAVNLSGSSFNQTINSAFTYAGGNFALSYTVGAHGEEVPMGLPSTVAFTAVYDNGLNVDNTNTIDMYKRSRYVQTTPYGKSSAATVTTFYHPQISSRGIAQEGLGFVALYYYTLADLNDENGKFKTPDTPENKYGLLSAATTGKIDLQDLQGHDIYNYFTSSSRKKNESGETTEYYTTLREEIALVRVLYVIPEIKDAEGHTIQQEIAVYRDLCCDRTNHGRLDFQTRARTCDIVRMTTKVKYSFLQYTELPDSRIQGAEFEFTSYFSTAYFYGDGATTQRFSIELWKDFGTEIGWKKIAYTKATAKADGAEADTWEVVTVEEYKSRFTINIVQAKEDSGKKTWFLQIQSEEAVGQYRIYFDLDPNMVYQWKANTTTAQAAPSPEDRDRSDAVADAHYYMYYALEIEGQNLTVEYEIPDIDYGTQFGYVINLFTEDHQAFLKDPYVVNDGLAGPQYLSGANGPYKYRIEFPDLIWGTGSSYGEGSSRFADQEGGAPSTPGTYVFKIYIWSFGNYNTATITGSFTINKRPLMLQWATDGDEFDPKVLPKVYNGPEGLDPYKYILAAYVSPLQTDSSPYLEHDAQVEGTTSGYAWEIQYDDNRQGGSVGQKVDSLVHAITYKIRIQLASDVAAIYTWDTKNYSEGICSSISGPLAYLDFTIEKYTHNDLEVKFGKGWVKNDPKLEGDIEYSRPYYEENLLAEAKTLSEPFFGSYGLIYVAKDIYDTCKAVYDGYQTQGTLAQSAPKGLYGIITDSNSNYKYYQTAQELQGLNVGTYYAIAYGTYHKIVDTGVDKEFGDYNFSEAYAPFKITKRLIEAPTIPNPEGGVEYYSYTGSNINITLNDFNTNLTKLGTTNTVSYDGALSSKDIHETSVEGGFYTQDAGTYQIWIKLYDGGKNTAWDVSHAEDQKDNYRFYKNEHEEWMSGDGEEPTYVVLTWVIHRKEIDPNDKTTYPFFKPNDMPYTGGTVYATFQKDGKETGYADQRDLDSYVTLVDGNTGTLAGKYTLHLQATSNYYIKGSGEGTDDVELSLPETEQPDFPVVWRIVPKIIPIPEANTTTQYYNGKSQDFTFDKNNFIEGIMRYSISGKSISGAEFAEPKSSDHYGIKYASDNEQLVASATYAGTYTVTLTFREANNTPKEDGTFQGNYAWEGWKEGQEYSATTTVTLTVQQYIFKINWSGDTEDLHGKDDSDDFWFTYDGKEHTLAPVPYNLQGGDTFTLVPKVYENGPTGSKIGTGKVSDFSSPIEKPSLADSSYYSVITRADVQSEEVQGITYAGNVDAAKKVHVFDNYAFDAEERSKEFGSSDRNDYAVYRVYSIKASFVLIPTLEIPKPGTDLPNADLGNYDGGTNNAIFVTYRGKKYLFNEFIKEWSKISQYITVTTMNGEVVDGDEFKPKDGITADLDSIMGFQDVLWTNDDHTALGYYSFTIAITDQDNYAWGQQQPDGSITAAERIGSDKSFTFYLQIKPYVLSTPALKADTAAHGISDAVFDTDYTGSAQEFTSAFDETTSTLYFRTQIGDNSEARVNVYLQGQKGIQAETDVLRDGETDAVKAYHVCVELADKTNFVWELDDLDQAEKTFYFRINPIALAVEWKGAGDSAFGSLATATYDGTLKTLETQLAASCLSGTDRGQVSIVYTLAVKGENTADSASIAQNGDKYGAKNAGYYTATVSSISGDKAKNYYISTFTFEEGGASSATQSAPSADFTIYKLGLTKPDYAGDEYTFNQKEQQLQLRNWDSTLMTLTSFSGKWENEDLGVNVESGFEAASGILKATHAGNYSFKIDLTDKENYYWIDDNQETNKLPDAATGIETAEYNDYWKIQPRKVMAPTLATGENSEDGKYNYRAQPRDGSALYPDFTNVNLQRASGMSDAKTIKVQGQDPWNITFSVQYYTAGGDEIPDPKTDGSSEVNYYYIVLTLILPNSADKFTDYEWISSTEPYEITQISSYLKEDEYADVSTVTKDSVTMKIWYRILKGRYSASFTMQINEGSEGNEWTYGQLKAQEGEYEISFLRSFPDNKAPDSWDYQQEKVTRSVTYAVTDESGHYDPRSDVIDPDKDKDKFVHNYKSGTLVTSNIDSSTEELFVPYAIPYAAGHYVALIHYGENGGSVGNRTLDEATFEVFFTIEKKEITVKWGDNKEYNGKHQLVDATVNNPVKSFETLQARVTDSSELQLVVQWVKGDGTLDANGPVDVNRTQTGDEVGTYTMRVTDIEGDAAPNYCFKQQGGKNDDTYDYHEFKITPIEITLQAGDYSRQYGDPKYGDADLSDTSGLKYEYASESDRILETDTTQTNSFAMAFIVYGYQKAYYGVGGSPEEGYKVLLATEVGSDGLIAQSAKISGDGVTYYTVVALKEVYGADFAVIYKNYSLKYLSGTYTITPKVVDAINWVEHEEDDFTYNGKDQFSKNFVTFANNSGDPTPLVPQVKFTLNGKDVTEYGFKYAGTYTFEVVGTNDSNYVLSNALQTSHATHQYTMQKREVWLKADGITTIYGDDPAEGTLKWSYEHTQDSAQFVDNEGNLVGSWSKELRIDDYAAGVKEQHSFTVQTTAERLSNAGGSYSTEIYGDGKKIDGELVCNNYIVHVTSGTHTIHKRTVNILWDENLTYYYNGMDQSENGNKAWLAYYMTQDDTPQKVYIYVRAIKSKSDEDLSQPIPFQYVKEGETPYLFYAYRLATSAEEVNYQLPDSNNAARFNENVYLKAREVYLAAADMGHVYGDEVPTWSGEKPGWTYSDASADGMDGAELHQFVNSDAVNFWLSVEATFTDGAKTKVSEYANAFELFFNGNAALTKGTHDGTYVTSGDPDREGYDYRIHFTNATVTVHARPITVTYTQQQHEYGIALAKLMEKVEVTLNTVKYGELGGTNEDLILADGDTNEGVFSIEALFGVSGGKYPDVKSYPVRLTLLDKNYTINYVMGSSEIGDLDSDHSTQNASDGYIITNSTILGKGFTLTPYSGDYNAELHDFFTAISGKYYTDRQAQQGTPVSYNEWEGTALDETNNFFGIYFYYSATEWKAETMNDSSWRWESAPASPTFTLGDGGYTAEGWTTVVPQFKHAGNYTVCYAIVAKNHTIYRGNTHVTIQKTSVTVSTAFEAYYSEDIEAAREAGFRPTFTFNGLQGGESLEDGEVTVFGDPTNGSPSLDDIGWTVVNYTPGTSVVGQYNITLTFDTLNTHAPDYNFSAASSGSRVTIKALPITVTVDTAKAKNTYYFNAAVGKEGPWDLNKLGEGFAYTITVDVASLLRPDQKITDIFKDDYKDSDGVHTGVTFFTLSTLALPNGLDSTTTLGVGTHDITLNYTSDGNQRYAVTLKAEGGKAASDLTIEDGFTITEAEFKRETLSTYGGTYDEAFHNAVKVQSGGSEVLAGFAESADGNAPVWQFVVRRYDNDSAKQAGMQKDANYRNDGFFSDNGAKGTNPELIDAGMYVIYYRLSLANHTTVYNVLETTITKATNRWTTEYTLKKGGTDFASGNSENAWTYGAYEAVNNPNGYNASTITEVLPVPAFNRKFNVSGNENDTLNEGLNEQLTITLTKNGDDQHYTFTYYGVAANELVGWLSQNSTSKTQYKNGALLGAADTYTITYQIGSNENQNYEPISGSYTFKIGKKDLTVRADDQTIYYGQDAPSTYTVTYTGFVNGEGEKDLSAMTQERTFLCVSKITSGAQQTEKYEKGYVKGSVGTYYIFINWTATQNEPNYNITLCNTQENAGHLNVEKRALTINIQDHTNRYNFNISQGVGHEEGKDWKDDVSAMVTVTAPTAGNKYNGFYQNEIVEILKLKTNALTWRTENNYAVANITGTNNVGKYAIEYILLDPKGERYGKNYDLTFTGSWEEGEHLGEWGTFTIEKAQITLEVEQMPEDGLIYTGHQKTFKDPKVNGDVQITFTIVYYQDTGDGNYTKQLDSAPTDVGKYKVGFSTTDDNYTATESEVKFEIKPKTVKVSYEIQKYVDVSDDLIPVGKGNELFYYARPYVVVGTVGVQDTDKPNAEGANDNYIVYADRETYRVVIIYRKNSSEAPEAIDVGTYYAVGHIRKVGSDVDDGNYTIDPSTGSTSFTISKQVLADPSATYDGGASSTIAYNGDDRIFSINDYLGKIDEHIKGSVMQLSFKYSETGNYGSATEYEEEQYAGQKISINGENDAWKVEWAVRDVGFYYIVVTLRSSENYQFLREKGNSIRFTLQVTQKHINLKAKDIEIVYGEEFDETFKNENIALVFSLDAVGEYSDINGLCESDIQDGKVKDGVFVFDKQAVQTQKADALRTAYTNRDRAETQFNLILPAVTSKNYTIDQFNTGVLKVVPREITLQIVDPEEASTYQGEEFERYDLTSEADPKMPTVTLKNGTLNTHVETAVTDLRSTSPSTGTMSAPML